MSPRPGVTRGYGVTRWGRAFIDVVEGRPFGDADHRRITQARRYFRDRHVQRLHIGTAVVTASVQGSQLDPFDVTLTVRAVDSATVIGSLRAAGATAELMSVARGEQPTTLGELLLPSESPDVATECTCPDDAPRCLHVLCVAYEVAAEIDRHAATLLTVAGTDLAELLDVAADPPDDTDGTTEHVTVPIVDFFGTHAVLPPLPDPPRMDPMTDLDTDVLRAALRASGVARTAIGETIDSLGALYDDLRGD